MLTMRAAAFWQWSKAFQDSSSIKVIETIDPSLQKSEKKYIKCSTQNMLLLDKPIRSRYTDKSCFIMQIFKTETTYNRL